MYELLTLYFQKKDIAFRTEENLFDIFDQELSNLENDFAKYLRTIDQNLNYQTNAKLLFEKFRKPRPQNGLNMLPLEPSEDICPVCPKSPTKNL